MRKSLLTVALACAFPVAYAQSSVTLYGIVDVGFEHLDVGNVDATRLQSGMSAGSRWGIRGSEDLRPGYSRAVCISHHQVLLPAQPKAHIVPRFQNAG